MVRVPQNGTPVAAYGEWVGGMETKYVTLKVTYDRARWIDPDDWSFEELINDLKMLRIYATTVEVVKEWRPGYEDKREARDS